MKNKFKKSFTLIELIITIFLSFLLLNFISSFQFNFLKELKLLEAKEKLAMQSFKLMEIVTKGLSQNSYFVPGMISADTLDSSIKFVTYTGNSRQYYITNSHLSVDSYTYKNIIVKNNLELVELEDKNSNTNTNIFSIKYTSAIKSEYLNIDQNETTYKDYTRLVYTK